MLPKFTRTLVGPLALAAVCSLARSLTAAPPAPIILFQTGFEAFEGYGAGRDLVGPDGKGQNGWVAYGYAGNGILADPVPGFDGQYAYIGFAAGKQPDPFNLWRPVNLTPQPGSPAVVTFKVSFEIVDSTTRSPYFDDFRWSVYTVEGSRLITLDFNNEDRLVYFALDDGKPFAPTGFSFANAEPYDLELSMDFARNAWTARINGAVIANGKPLTTQKSVKLDLGDVDAVWALRDPAHPGDNYMIFDDYSIAALAVSDIPPTLAARGMAADGSGLVDVFGEPGVTYAIEASTDLATWVSVGRPVAASVDGVAHFSDPDAKQVQARFYRATSLTQ